MNIKFYKDFLLYFMEVIKWAVVVILLILTGVGNYVFCDYSLLYRVIVVFFVLVFAIYLSLLTRYGRSVVIFVKEAISEVRKVIWPTFRESVYTTVIVFIVTVIISMILWGLDGILVYFVSLGLRF